MTVRPTLPFVGERGRLRGGLLALAALGALPLANCSCGEDLDPLDSIETGELTGVICLEDSGFPSADTRLRYEGEAGVTLEGTTDDHGAFDLSEVPAGPGRLVVETEGAARHIDVDVVAGETTHYVDTACRDGYGELGVGRVAGVVCNRHVGALVSDADVIIVLPDETTLTTTTDMFGEFVLPAVPPGEHILTVQSPGFQRSWLIEVNEGEETYLDAGSDCQTPDATSALVNGVLCDPVELGPLAGAQVTAVDRSGETYTDVTDTDGTFTVGPVTPGSVEIVVEKGELRIELAATALPGEEVWVSGGGACVQETCAEQVFEPAEQIDGSLFLVVDRSGSMSSAAPGYGTTRWAALVDAISTLTSELEESIEFGLMLFPDRATDDCGPGVVHVDPAYGRAGLINGVLDEFESSPLGPTPTADTLAAARAYLAPRVAPDRKIAVVLATDGGPNCNASLDPLTCTCTTIGVDTCADFLDGSGCLDNVDTVAEVAALQALGIDTYVIGIPGVEDFGWVLDQMAQAGGTALGGETDFYAAYDIDALQAAFDDIGRRLSSCTLTLDEVSAADAARIEVLVGDGTIVRDVDHLDGFDVTGEDTITLYGAACEAWQADAPTITVHVCDLVLE